MSAYFKKFMPMFEQKLTQIALSFMDNFYILPLCLNYEPIYIVLACYNLIIKNSDITFPDLPDGKKWYEMFMIDFNNVKMLEIGKQISIISKLTHEKNENDIKNKNKKPSNTNGEDKRDNKDININFYKFNDLKQKNSANIEDEKDLQVEALKYTENKDYKEYKECCSIEIKYNQNYPKSTSSEKITMDSDSNLDENAYY